MAERGFTDDARAAALANDALPLAPTDLSSTHPDQDVVRAVPALWPKVVTFTPEILGVKWTDNDVPADGWGERSPLVGLDDGRIVGTLMDLVERTYRDHLPELMEQIGLADVKQDAVRRFVLVLKPQAGDDLQLSVDGVPRTIFVINDRGRGYSVRQVTATGKGEIKVSKVPLMAGRLGEVNVTFAYGEGTVGGRDALLVVTERDDETGQLTIRVRPATDST